MSSRIHSANSGQTVRLEEASTKVEPDESTSWSQQYAIFQKYFRSFKLALSTTDSRIVLEKIASLALLVAEADSAWILIAEANQPGMYLARLPKCILSECNRGSIFRMKTI